MSAAATDKFLLTGVPGTATNLAAPGYTIGNSSITVTSTADFPTTTGVIFGIDVVEIVNGEEERVDGSYCVFAGVVTGPSTIGSLTLLYGSPQNYAAGAMTRVYITISTYHNQRLIEGILAEHKQDGTHGAVHADSVTSPQGTYTNLTVTNLTIGGAQPAAGWSPVGQTFTYTGNNGNKEFTGTFPTDLTSTLFPGQKLQFTRNTVPSTQSMAFAAATSQYATKSSPSGITFTSAFTCEAWVYLNSYNSTDMGIISRTDNATGGFWFGLHNTGQIWVQYGSASAFTQFQSYVSIPLKRWVHVGAVVTSVSGKTGQMYINGVAVSTQNNVSTSTVLTQTGNLTIGTFAAPSNNYFDGYIAEARVWSVAQSQAQIQANMGLSLTTATNLVANFPGAGNFNDVSGNSNNLTSSGGAIATQAANPFNAIEYAEIASLSYSSPNTTVILNTGDFCVLPNMTLTNAQYSVVANPFGMPADVAGAAFRRAVYNQSSPATSSTTATPVLGMTFGLTIPAGGKKLRAKAFASDFFTNTSGAVMTVTIWEGTVGTGRLLARALYNGAAGTSPPLIIDMPFTTDAGSKTYNLGYAVVSNSGQIESGPGYPLVFDIGEDR